MSQADSAHTTIPSRISFASPGAVRRTRRAPRPTELAIAFDALKASIGDLEQPYEPKYEADADDLGEWAGHLEQVLGAALTYARAVVAHLDEVTPGGVADETGGLADAASDVAGALRNAANRLDEAA